MDQLAWIPRPAAAIHPRPSTYRNTEAGRSEQQAEGYRHWFCGLQVIASDAPPGRSQRHYRLSHADGPAGSLPGRWGRKPMLAHAAMLPDEGSKR